MRVLWFSNTPALGSGRLGINVVSGGWLYSLASELHQVREIELGIVFYSGTRIEPFSVSGVDLFPVYNGMDSQVRRIWRLLRHTDESKKDTGAFLGIIRDFKPDLVHIHGTEMSFVRILDKTDLPVVVSFQGNMTVCTQFFYRGLSRSDIRKYTSLKRKIRLISYNRKYKSFAKRARREQACSGKIRYVIGRTEWDRRIQAFFAPGARYFHNDEILRKEFYLHQWEAKARDRFVVYTTGSDMLFKGLETVVESAALLQNHLPRGFVWRIGGISGSEYIVDILRKKYRSRYPSQSLEFLGGLDEKGVVRELLAADLYVMPSHMENSPNNLCEAMIIGVPCIASFAGGTKSLLEDGKEGVLVQDGDPWSMAGAIMELFRDRERAVVYGTNARKRALARHDPEKITTGLVKIYETILSDD